MSFKNLFIKILLKLFQGLPRHAAKNQRFLVVSTTGLGDTLWGTPAIRALKKTYPNAYVGVLTSPMGKEVLKNNPHIDEFFVVQEPAFFSLVRLWWKVRRRKIGAALIFHTSQRGILPFCQLIGAGQIIGSEGINKGLDFILTTALKRRTVHEIERRLEIVREVGAKTPDASMELSLSDRDKKEGKALLEKIPPYIPIIGLHPGAKDRFKQWPPEYFAAIGKQLQDHLGCQIVITGNRMEKELVEKIANGIPEAISITGQLSVHALGALIQRMSLFISNDTGPMHIACALNTPVIALFAPTDPRLCCPYHVPKAAVIQREPTCRPCLKKRCQEPFCLLQISKDAVFQTALRLFYG